MIWISYVNAYLDLLVKYASKVSFVKKLILNYYEVKFLFLKLTLEEEFYGSLGKG